MGPLWLQVSEMSEMLSLRLRAKFGTSLNMVENLQQKSSIIM